VLAAAKIVGQEIARAPCGFRGCFVGHAAIGPA
jgi:hypothetical protein